MAILQGKYIVRLNLFICFSLLKNVFEEQLAFQWALKEFVGSLDPSYTKESDDLFVALDRSFGKKHLTPQMLNSKFI